MKPGQYFDTLTQVLEKLGVNHQRLKRLGYTYHPESGHGSITYIDEHLDVGISSIDVDEDNILPATMECYEWLAKTFDLQPANIDQLESAVDAILASLR